MTDISVIPGHREAMSPESIATSALGAYRIRAILHARIAQGHAGCVWISSLALGHPGMTDELELLPTRVRQTAMKSAPLVFFACVTPALLASLAGARAATSPVITRHRTITCPFLADGNLTIDVPPARNARPAIDFDYPARATLFSFRDNNLFLVAMDESDPSRLRVVISAQRNRKNGSYDGQIFVDMGGNQLMHYNGPVHCRVAEAPSRGHAGNANLHVNGSSGLAQ